MSNYCRTCSQYFRLRYAVCPICFSAEVVRSRFRPRRQRTTWDDVQRLHEAAALSTVSIKTVRAYIADQSGYGIRHWRGPRCLWKVA